MKRVYPTLICLLLAFLWIGALAESGDLLTLPVGTTIIEAEAFMGDAALAEVILPDGIKTIGARAFAGSSIESIMLPKGLESIGEDAFADCPNLTAIVVENSLGHSYCEENSVPYEVISKDIINFLEMNRVVWEDISSIASNYEDGSGYVTESELPIVLSEIGAYIEDLYAAGTISDYYIGNTNVCYTLNGFRCYYIPYLEGMLSGGDDVSFTVLTMRPEKTKDPTVATKLDGVADNILSTFKVYDKAAYYTDQQVNMNAFWSLTSDQIILWNSHGSYDEKTGDPILVTGMYCNEDELDSDMYNFMENAKRNGDAFPIYGGNRFGIGSSFIDRYSADLSGSMVWLGSCYSAKNPSMPNAFLNHGASVVVGFTSTVSKLYHDLIFEATLNYMLEKDANGEYHTISEALAYAKEQYGAYDPISAGGAKAEVFPYDSDYRLLERIQYRGMIYGKSANTGEEPKPLAEAYLEFECLDDSDYTKKIYAAKDGSYQVDLYEGNYTVTVKEDNNILTSDEYESTTFSLDVKRYDDQELDITLKRIEGSVAGAITDSSTKAVIERVALSIADSDGEIVWTGETDADGFYRAYLVPGSYTMNAIKENYNSATFSFTITADTQTTLNKTLTPITGKISGTVTDIVSGDVMVGVMLSFLDSEGNIVLTTRTSGYGEYSVTLPVGDYTLEFLDHYRYQTIYSIVEGIYPFTVEENQSLILDCAPTCVHRYELHCGFTSYASASETAESLNGHLVTLTTADENSRIFSWLKSFTGRNPWLSGSAYIGLNCANEDSEWRWVTEEPFEYSNWYIYGKYHYPLGYAGHNYAQFASSSNAAWMNQANPTSTDTYYVFEWDAP